MLVVPQMATGCEYIFLQGKIRQGQTFLGAIQSCMKREAGLEPSDFKVHSDPLGWFLSRLPLDRTRGVPTSKHIVFWSVEVLNPERVVPSEVEIRRIDWAASSRQFARLMPVPGFGNGGAHRSHKCFALRDMVNEAQRLGLVWPARTTGTGQA